MRLLALALALLSAPTLGREGDASLEQFLQRLGLVELQTHHLEQQLDGEPAERLAIARRLADLYASQLVATLSDSDRYDNMMLRINGLLEKVPQAKTPSLEVMLLQAEYTRAEKLIGLWIANHKEVSARRQAAEVLTDIAPQLEQHQQKLSSRVEKLIDEADAIQDEQAHEAKSQELRRLQLVAGRAGYFAAWSVYYRALIEEVDSQAQAGFAKSRALFQQLLGIGGDYQEIKPEFMALESIWRARALIGLASAEASAGNPAGSDLCFAWLEHGSVPLAIKEQVPYWRLQALLNSSRHADALKFARQKVESFTSSNSPSKFSFCVSLVRAGFAGPPEPTRRDLGIQGIAGLAKIGRHGAVRQLIEEYGIEPEADSGFYLRWIKGQQLFDRAEQSGNVTAYEQAAAVLEEALDAPDAKRDLGAAAQCRWHLAWCHYRQGNDERAGRLFEQASIGLGAAGNRLAAKAAWMAFLSYRRLISNKNRRFVSSAIAVLKLLQSNYPEDELAKQAAFHITKLQQNASTPAETLVDLEKVRPGAANYLAARYDICLQLHKLWSASKSDQRAAHLRSLATAVETYLRRASRDTNNSRKVKCCLLMVGAAMTEPASWQLAKVFMNKARPFVAGLARGDRSVAEFHYRALLLARQSGEEDAQQEHVRWLVDNGRGSPYEKVALGLAAQAIDRQIRTKGGAANRSELVRAHGIYDRLTELLGAEPGQIRASKNARVALSKRAHYASLLGQPAESAAQLEQLLAVYSKNKDYIRRAGLAHYQAQAYQNSIGHWRRLLSGLPKASDEWFEAKYYQLSCLSHLDLTKFRQVLRQFQLLYPSGGSPKWRARFEELQKR